MKFSKNIAVEISSLQIESETILDWDVAIKRINREGKTLRF